MNNNFTEIMIVSTIESPDKSTKIVSYDEIIKL
jgi:hypothetical protein